MAIQSRPVVENGFTVIRAARQMPLGEKIMIMVNYMSATGLAPAMVFAKAADEYIIGPVQYTATLDSNKYKFCGALGDALNLDHVLCADKRTISGTPSVVGDDSQGVMKRVAPARIPRPRNAWIMFRQAMSANIHKNNAGITAADVSRVAATMWSAASAEVRTRFYSLAAEEAASHRAKYPTYQYGGGVRKYKQG